jgi:hypothetical protein
METQKQEHETLEDLLNHFLVVKELWQEERQKLTQQNTDFGKLVIRLSAQVEKFKETEAELKKQVTQSISQASAAMAEKAAREFKMAVTGDVEYASQRLKDAAEKSVDQLEKLKRDQSERSMMFSIGLFVLPIIASLLIFWLLSPKPALPLSGQQISIYEDGQMLDGFWSKLNKKQQEFLADLGNGKINNHGKRMEEMQNADQSGNNMGQ